MQSLDVISVNLWQIIISLLNLIILFLGVKKFLYKPVCSMMAKMQAEVDEKYADAENAKNKAMEDEKFWNEKIQSAKREADDIISDASIRAKSSSERIVSDAKEKAALTLEGCHLVFIFDMIHFTTGANSTSMEKATLFHLSRQKMGCFRKNDSLERFPMDLVHIGFGETKILCNLRPRFIAQVTHFQNQLLLRIVQF